MNITIEYIDVNPINTFDLLTAVQIAQPIIKARLLNMSLPQATVILGPDFAVGKKAGGLIASYLPYKGDFNVLCFFVSIFAQSFSFPFVSFRFVSFVCWLVCLVPIIIFISTTCPSEFISRCVQSRPTRIQRWRARWFHILHVGIRAFGQFSLDCGVCRSWSQDDRSCKYTRLCGDIQLWQVPCLYPFPITMTLCLTLTITYWHLDPNPALIVTCHKTLLQPFPTPSNSTLPLLNLPFFHFDSCFKTLPMATAHGMTVVYNHTIPSMDR